MWNLNLTKIKQDIYIPTVNFTPALETNDGYIKSKRYAIVNISLLRQGETRKKFKMYKDTMYRNIIYWDEYIKNNSLPLDKFLYATYSSSINSKPHNSIVVILTEDGTRITRKFSNTIRLLSLYQKTKGIKVVLFTDSRIIISYTRHYNITSYPVIHKNVYNLPILKYLLLLTKEVIKADQYIYINSDILLNPVLFSLINQLDKEFHHKDYLFAGTAYNSLIIPENLSFTSNNAYISSLQPFRGHRRLVGEIDIFVFPLSFPFELLPEVVVGRYWVDYVILQLVHFMKFDVVDISEVMSIHQGLIQASLRVVKTTEEDFLYNAKFLDAKLCSYSGELQANYRLESI